MVDTHMMYMEAKDMTIEPEIKIELKQRKLTQLKQRYFSLQMDLESLRAVGNIEGVETIVLRMENVQKAYDAVEAMSTE